MFGLKKTNAIPKEIITILGDSTIDNKVWTEKNNSVINQLRKLLPNYNIQDYSNDGFTTRDILDGAYKDKVFPHNRSLEYPHEMFHPLTAAEENIKKSKHIILSIGGNNFREFLSDLLNKRIPAAHIEEEFNSTLKNMQSEYILIVEKIRALNPEAQITLMTQYYPSFPQDKAHYKIYHGLTQLAKSFPHLFNKKEEQDLVAHELMKNVYQGIFDQISKKKIKNIVVADITSSLNPYNDPDGSSNHTFQIEPNAKGGFKIANILKYFITNRVKPWFAYRFNTNHWKYDSQSKTQVPIVINQNDVVPTKLRNQTAIFLPPKEIKKNSLSEEKIDRNAEEDLEFCSYMWKEDSIFEENKLSPEQLLSKLETEINELKPKLTDKKQEFTLDTEFLKAVTSAKDEAKRLLNSFDSNNSEEEELIKWKKSVLLLLNVLELKKNPSVENQDKFKFGIEMLNDNAKNRALGKSAHWDNFKFVLKVVAAVAAVVLIATVITAVILLSKGTLALALPAVAKFFAANINAFVLSTVLGISGATVAGNYYTFHSGRQKSLSKKMDDVACISLKHLKLDGKS